MDTGHAVRQFGLDSKSPSFRAAPWLLSLGSHLVLATFVLIAWHHSRTPENREWRLVSTLDLRESRPARVATTDMIPTSASSATNTPVASAPITVGAASPASDFIIPYPEAARRRGEEGVVGAEWSVNGRGQAQQIKVTEPSGSRALDDAVLNAIQDHRFPPSLGLQKAKFRFVLTQHPHPPPGGGTQ